MARQPRQPRQDQQAVSTDHLHVVPLNDRIKHDTTCTCGTTDQPAKRDDGSVGWLTIHHSLDGREATE